MYDLQAISNEDYNMRIDTDGVKLITSKLAKNISDSSIQVLGGNGYIGEYHVERFWRDSKLLEIGGGTNEILQKNITKDIIKLNKNF
jgi:isovaleryl-CoA dehydrogenase